MQGVSLTQMDKTKNWPIDLREIFSHFWREKG